MFSTRVSQTYDEGSEAEAKTFAPRNRIRNEDHRNWIRCNLGLQEVADALRPYVEQVFRNYWDSEFWWSCHNRCDSSDCEKKFAHCHCESSVHTCTYWYDHNHPENLQCPIKRRGDNWYIYTKKDCKGCNDQFAKVLSLFLDPKSPKICWKNVQFPIRDKGPWEIAKAFMPQGNRLVDTPDQAEGIALLNVINTCKLFDKDEDDKHEDDKHEDDKDEDDKHEDDRHEGIDHNLISKLIGKKNILTHRASCEITNYETNDFFDLMLNFLHQLSLRCACFKQLKNLRELREKTLVGELVDKAYSPAVQDLMTGISDLIASGKDSSNLIESLQSTVTMHIQHTSIIADDDEVEVEKKREKIIYRRNGDTAQENLVKEKEQMVETMHDKIKELEDKTKQLQKKEVDVLTEEINEKMSKENQDMKGKLLRMEEDNKRLQEENQKIRLQMESQKAEEMKVRKYLEEMEAKNERLDEAIGK